MSYAVSNREGDHLGFILLSGGPDSGDCLVRSLPAEEEYAETPESQPLLKLQALGELYWERVADVFQIYDLEGEIALKEREISSQAGDTFIAIQKGLQIG